MPAFGMAKPFVYNISFIVEKKMAYQTSHSNLFHQENKKIIYTILTLSEQNH